MTITNFSSRKCIFAEMVFSVDGDLENSWKIPTTCNLFHLLQRTQQRQGINTGCVAVVAPLGLQEDVLVECTSRMYL